jgi:SWIM zinc finger
VAVVADTLDSMPAPPPERWTDEQVVALAPGRIGAARAVAEPSTWHGLGADERALWGQCGGSGREPYDVAVDHVTVQAQCSCPSRQRPCKHALGLLLLWAHGQVPPGDRPARLGRWLAANAARLQQPAAGPAPSAGLPAGADAGAGGVETAGQDGAGSGAGDASGVGVDDGGGDAPGGGEEGAGGDGPGDGDIGEAPAADHDETSRPPGIERDSTRAQRVAAGLAELDRWLVDRMRAGIADPTLGSYATWDAVAARLVDAQASGLANRVRRVGAAVGARPDWHDHVLAEIGVLHLLARAGQRLGQLPPDLADGVAAAIGWQVRQADVLANTPETDTWLVAGRSDTLEDRIVVRRLWLHGAQHGWAMLLSFAAFGQSLDAWPAVGMTLDGDLHRYPGTIRLRALLGDVKGTTAASDASALGGTIAEGCAEVGAALAAEPWLERYPIAVRATATVANGRWLLTDRDGALPLATAATTDELATLLAATAGQPAVVVVEWTPQGVVPVAVHTPTRSTDVGPRGGFTGRPLRDPQPARPRR